MIVGFTGHHASGKDACGSYLQGKGFISITLSDFLRQECVRRKIVPYRQTLIDIANEMRTASGRYGILAEKAIAIMEEGKNYSITGVMNPGEVTTLRARPPFILVALYAPPEIRLRRMLERPDRPDNIRTMDDLLLFEKQQQSSDPAKQQMHVVLELADITINTETGLAQLYKELDKVAAQYASKTTRQ